MRTLFGRSSARPTAVILFDGECNLCNAAVTFVIERDRRGVFSFAPLQSKAAERLLGTLASERAAASPPTPGAATQTLTDGQPDPWQSVVLVEGGHVYRRSTASLRVLRHLSLPWPLLTIFLLAPARLRDAVYTFIARRRYRWAGKRETCLIPTPELRARFLE